MRLDFNETNILVQALGELENQGTASVNKSALIDLLYALYDNTEDKYIFIRSSVRTLVSKLENLSEENIKQIYTDKNNNHIIATTCYVLPEL